MFFKRRERQQKKLMKQQKFGASLVSITEPDSFLAEQFRTLRTNLDFSKFNNDTRSILISSSILAEGKSTIIANLALVFASTGKSVVLVDADLRKPSVHRTFKLNNKEGLTTLLANPNIQINDIIQRKIGIDISMIPSGPIPPNPSELLSSEKMNEIISELESQFDLVIIDAPPLLAVTDARIIANKVDGVLLVARQDYVNKEEVYQSKVALERVNANIIGCVLNGTTETGES